MKVRVLGTLAVVSNGEHADLGGPKQRAVLGMLATRPGQLVDLYDLIEGVWGDEPPNAVRSSVHAYVSHLRSALPGALGREGSAYRLDIEPRNVDAVEFERLVEVAQDQTNPSPADTSVKLREALGLWRGRPYAGLESAPGLYAEARRLDELRLNALEARIDGELALGRHNMLIGELEALAAEHPYRERFRAQHMLALFRSGRQAEALRAFDATRSILVEELGIDPSPELQTMYDGILLQDPELLVPVEIVTERVVFLEIDVSPAADAGGHTVDTLQALIREAVHAHDGRVFGDSEHGATASFTDVVHAAACAVSLQRRLVDALGAEARQRGARIGIDTGPAQARAGVYSGPTIARVERLAAAAHAGQILVSQSAEESLRLSPGIQLRTLGRYELFGIAEPQTIYQVVADGLEPTFPELDIGRTIGGDELLASYAVKSYELRERLEFEEIGSTYRAYQASLGREVTIRTISSEVANQPDFMQRFEAEAQAVARLEHPHIVPLFDFWRTHDGAYLVTPFIDGPSIDEMARLKSAAEIGALVSQLVSAVSHAHRRNVTHGALSQRSIRLDAEGNAYLSFHNSSMFGPGPVHNPERAERSDIAGLTSLAAQWFSMSGGRPRAIEELADRITRGEPTTIADLTQAVGVAVSHEDEHSLVPDRLRNPYKGLASFGISDAADFYGRGDETALLIDLVASHPFVTLTGPSGCGKSSVLHAGLLAHLVRQPPERAERWLGIGMTPGRHPFESAAAALETIATDEPGDLVGELMSDVRALGDAVARLVAPLDARLVLVVDQFEELYTVVDSDELRNAFISSIVSAIESSRSRLSIVAAIRADFLAKPLADPILAPLVSEPLVALGLPSADRLLGIVQRPAASAGVDLQPGLAQRIVADVLRQPGALPLLQFVLADLVAGSPEGRVTIADYEERGGVDGAVAHKAQALFADMTPAQQEAARQVLLRMVTVTEDADDVRRRVRLAELRALDTDRSVVDRVLEDFGAARLLTFDRDPTTRAPTAEVAHEALLREWPLLRSWVTERREWLILRRRFESALDTWREADQSTDVLPTGGQLAQFEAWAAEAPGSLARHEQEFLASAIAHREHIETQRRRRRRSILAAFAAAAVVSALLGVAAWIQRAQAREAAVLATARALILEAGAQTEVDPELAVHLALRAIDSFRESGGVPAAAVDALRNATNAGRIVSRFPGGSFVDVGADGDRFLVADGDGGLAVVDSTSLDVIDSFQLEGHVIASATYLGTDDVLASSRGTQDWFRWRASQRTWEQLPLASGATDLLVSPEGDLVAYMTKSESAVVTVLDTGTGATRFNRDLGDGGTHLAFGPENTLVVVDDRRDGVVLAFLDTATGREQFSIDFGEVPFMPTLGAFSSDNTLLAFADSASAGVVEVGTGEILWTSELPGRAYRPLWLPGDERLLIGGEGLFTIVDALAGEVLEEVPGNVGGSWYYELVPGTQLVVSADNLGDDTLVFDMSAGRRGEVATLANPLPTFVRMSPDDGGRHLTVLDWVSHAVIDIDEGQVERAIAGSDRGPLWPNFVYAVLSNNGSYVAALDETATSRVWNVSTGEVIYVAPDNADVRGVDNTGSLVVLFRVGADAQIVDVATETVIASIDEGPDFLMRANFTPDGQFLLTNNNGEEDPPLRIWNTRSGQLVATIDMANSGLYTEFDASGDRLIVSGYDGRVLEFDFDALLAGATPEESLVQQIPAHDNIGLTASFSPDGTMALSQTFSEPVKLWDLASGDQLAEFDADSGWNAAAFHPEEPWVFVADASTITVHTLDIDELIEIARSRLTRELAQGECEVYLDHPCEQEYMLAH